MNIFKCLIIRNKNTEYHPDSNDPQPGHPGPIGATGRLRIIKINIL